MASSKGLTGVCVDCGKRFRVPSADRAYHCKSCGGSLRVGEAPTDAAAGKENVTTPEERSKAELEAATPPRAARAERVAAGRDIRSAERAVKVVRWIFLLQAFGFLLATATAVAYLSEGDRASVILVCISAGMLALALTGLHLSALHPFTCSILLASFYSLGLVATLLTGTLPIGQILWGVLLWLAVPPTSRVKSALQAHPEVFAARRMLGEVRAKGLGYDELRRRAAQRAWRNVGITWAVTVLIVGLASFGAWSSRRSPAAPSAAPTPDVPVDGAVTAFRDAWRSGDPAALARLCRIESQEHMRGSFERLEQKRGWTTGWPALAEHELQGKHKGSLEVWFQTPEGKLRTVWSLDERETWRLGFIDAPGD